MPSLADIARATSEQYAMLPEGAPVLSMVSGGADSVALLTLLAAGELGAMPLRVLHVNHLLRGPDADADEAFVVALCEELGVACRVVRYDVSAYAEAEGLNLEDAGRRVRHRFAAEELDRWLEALGRPGGDGRVAVAHTADDRTETVLMRLVSGAGPRALLGIRPVRDRIVRPLIDARRGDVIAWLEERGQAWREDATNADTRRLRAAVRLDLLPLLRTLNPRFDEALARTLTVLGDEDALLDEMARGFADAFAEQRPGSVALDVPFMRTLSRPMARRVVREALARSFPESARLEFDHIEAVVDGLAAERFARDLGHGLRAWSEYGKMFLSREEGPAPPVAPFLLGVPGGADLGASGTLEADVVGPGDVSDDPAIAVLDAGRVRGPLVVDGPRDGDRMRPLGMEGTRRLADMLAEAKVPRRERPGVPVVRDGEDVVWLAGVRLSEDYKVTPATVDAIRIRWHRPGAKEGSETHAS